MLEAGSDGSIFCTETNRVYNRPSKKIDKCKTTLDPHCDECDYLMHHCDSCMEFYCSHSKGSNFDVMPADGAPGDCPIRK